MHPFPHRYTVRVAGGAAGDVSLDGDRLPSLASAAPAEFDGPGDRWSPETLLVAALGDCLILTFRAVAAASKLPWTALSCEVEGTLDRVDRVTRFTRFDLRATLQVPEGTDVDRARRLVEKAEHSCLVSNSLNAERHLDVLVEVEAPV